MSPQTQPDTTQTLSSDAKQVVQAFKSLGTDDQLALLYYIYEKMGDSITPAAPTAAEPNLAPMLLDDFYNLSDDEQLEVMRDIVNRADTEYSRAYGALTANNQLLVWFAWAQGMGDNVVDIPQDYKPEQATNSVLNQIENLEFESQISILRQVAQDMGYSDIKPIPSQAETGVTPSL